MKELVGDITSPRMPFQVGQIEIVLSDQSRSFRLRKGRNNWTESRNISSKIYELMEVTHQNWNVCPMLMICLGYAINFFLCEILALFNIVGMIYFTDRFLGYQFTTVRKSLGQD